MARKSSLTAQQRAEEIAMYLNGKSCPDIAKATGRAIDSIRCRMRKAGVLRTCAQAGELARSQGKTIKANQERAAEARTMISKGLKSSEICSLLEVSHATLSKIRNMGNVKRVRIKRQATDTRIPYELFKKMRDQQQVSIHAD